MNQHLSPSRFSLCIQLHRQYCRLLWTPSEIPLQCLKKGKFVDDVIVFFFFFFFKIDPIWIIITQKNIQVQSFFCLKKDIIKHYPFETIAWWIAGEIKWTFSLTGSGWKHPISYKKETKWKIMYKWMRGNCCSVIGLFGLFLKGTEALQKPPALCFAVLYIIGNGI